MAKAIKGAENLFQQKLEDVALFATGAEGNENLGETVNMRYELDLPEKYYAMTQQDVERKSRGDDKKVVEPVVEAPETVSDQLNTPRSPTRTTFYNKE